MTKDMLTSEGKAFEILVREHHRRLLAYATAMTGAEDTAQDIVQESFLVAHRKLDSFDTSRDFGAWMRGIVRNKFREWLRREQRSVSLDEATLDSLELTFRHFDSDPNDELTFSALRACLKALPDVLHKAVDLFYLNQLSGAETAQRLETSEATVRKRLQRAREQLALCITGRLEMPHE